MPGARAMAVSDDGKKVYVGTRVVGRVYEVTDAGDKRTVRVVVEKLTLPAGVAFKDGALYVFAVDKVLKYNGITLNPNVEPQDLTAKFDLPPEQHHNWKYVAFGPDGKLYVPFGSPCNICEPPTKEYGQIRRYDEEAAVELGQWARRSQINVMFEVRRVRQDDVLFVLMKDKRN